MGTARSLGTLLAAITAITGGTRLDSVYGQNTENVQAIVQQMLDEQAAAWNVGDLDRFMEYYWNSADLTFSSGGRTTRGWRETRDRYRQRYPDRTAMGLLSFDDLEVQSLGDDACFVLGQWSLRREADDPSGNFTLVIRKIDDRWRIVHDHTSVLEEPH